jgi:signal transduction histidine kinase
VLGTIQLASRAPRKFRPEEIHLLETIGNQVGVAVQKAQLYEETTRQARELERANKLQADFSAMIAHDLRSPLMNIMGVAEVMIDGMFGNVTEEQKKWLLRIQSSGRSLVDLVSDFLDVSKLESGYVEVTREAVDLAALIEKSIDSHRVLALDKKISIKAIIDSSLPSIHADPRRLDQVLSNLISNAIKFTGEKGQVEVGAAPAGAPLVNVWIRDNGVGIPSGDISRLFEKYRQAGNVSQSSQKGTGLGLVICKMIVEAHGGKIWVESTEGNGSTFFFSLPVNA